MTFCSSGPHWGRSECIPTLPGDPSGDLRADPPRGDPPGRPPQAGERRRRAPRERAVQTRPDGQEYRMHAASLRRRHIYLSPSDVFDKPLSLFQSLSLSFLVVPQLLPEFISPNRGHATPSRIATPAERGPAYPSRIALSVDRLSRVVREDEDVAPLPRGAPYTSILWNGAVWGP